MRKFLLALIFLSVGFVMFACTTEEETVIPLPDTISIAEVDQYLYRADTQYVDLRNFDDQMRGGWIRGFEMIPFFAYLEYENILVRDNGWTFSSTNIKNEAALRALFDEDRNILLMCAAGARAGYVREALMHLGYENVWNIGALGDYQGDNLVYGDDTFKITMPPRSWVDPLPTEISMATNIDSFVGRPNMQFIDLRNFSNMTTDGWHKSFTVVPFFEFLETENILVRSNGWVFSPTDIKNEQALRNIFDEEANIVLICAAGARAGYVRDALLHLGYENVWNAGALGDYEGLFWIKPWCTEDNDTDNNGTGGCE